MDRPPPTRSQLLELGARIRLAEQGRDLLHDKRRQLLEALGAAAADALRAGEQLEREAAGAHVTLALDAALDGPEALGSLALAAQSEIALEATTERVMGVIVPVVGHGEIGRGCADRGYALSQSSPRTDQVAERFERVVELVLAVAAREVRLRRLASEARKTARRVSALEHVVLPSLRSARRAIAGVLDERERQDRFRLARIERARRGGGA